MSNTEFNNHGDDDESHQDTEGLNTMELDCSICREILYKPVTLLCQHSFCYPCLKTFYSQRTEYGRNDDRSKCPICKIPYTLPPFHNKQMQSMIEDKFPEQCKIRKEEIKKEEIKKTMEDIIEKEVRLEVWNTISTDFYDNTLNDDSETVVQPLSTINAFPPSNIYYNQGYLNRFINTFIDPFSFKKNMSFLVPTLMCTLGGLYMIKKFKLHKRD